jgi:hypothetical protein
MSRGRSFSKIRETIRVRQRQWLQQDNIDDAVDGGRGADANSQREDDGGRECAMFCERAHGMCGVPSRIVEPSEGQCLS